jgi:hypothetical protein
MAPIPQMPRTISASNSCQHHRATPAPPKARKQVLSELSPCRLTELIVRSAVGRHFVREVADRLVVGDAIQVAIHDFVDRASGLDSRGRVFDPRCPWIVRQADWVACGCLTVDPRLSIGVTTRAVDALFAALELIRPTLCVQALRVLRPPRQRVTRSGSTSVAPKRPKVADKARRSRVVGVVPIPARRAGSRSLSRRP